MLTSAMSFIHSSFTSLTEPRLNVLQANVPDDTELYSDTYITNSLIKTLKFTHCI